MVALPHLEPSSINDQLPVPKAARRSCLALCRPSAHTLQFGLGLLGIPSLVRMGAAGCVGVGRGISPAGLPRETPVPVLAVCLWPASFGPMAQASPAMAAAAAQQPAAGLPLEALLGECPWAVTADKIDAVVARLVAVAAPLHLIAFGSAARGPLESANDLDLLVVEPTGANRYSEVVRLQKALRGLLIPVDLVVSSQAATNQRCHGPGTLEFTARMQGRLLHDSL